MHQIRLHMNPPLAAICTALDHHIASIGTQPQRSNTGDLLAAEVGAEVVAYSMDSLEQRIPGATSRRAD